MWGSLGRQPPPPESESSRYASYWNTLVLKEKVVTWQCPLKRRQNLFAEHPRVEMGVGGRCCRNLNFDSKHQNISVLKMPPGYDIARQYE